MENSTTEQTTISYNYSHVLTSGNVQDTATAPFEDDQTNNYHLNYYYSCPERSVHNNQTSQIANDSLRRCEGVEGGPSKNYERSQMIKLNLDKPNTEMRNANSGSQEDQPEDLRVKAKKHTEQIPASSSTNRISHNSTTLQIPSKKPRTKRKRKSRPINNFAKMRRLLPATSQNSQVLSHNFPSYAPSTSTEVPTMGTSPVVVPTPVYPSPRGYPYSVPQNKQHQMNQQETKHQTAQLGTAYKILNIMKAISRQIKGIIGKLNDILKSLEENPCFVKVISEVKESFVYAASIMNPFNLCIRNLKFYDTQPIKDSIEMCKVGHIIPGTPGDTSFDQVITRVHEDSEKIYHIFYNTMQLITNDAVRGSFSPTSKIIIENIQKVEKILHTAKAYFP